MERGMTRVRLGCAVKTPPRASHVRPPGFFRRAAASQRIPQHALKHPLPHLTCVVMQPIFRKAV